MSAAALNAPWLDDRRRPVILFSHGFGGTARMMGWFTTNLARAGFVVVAVDHPGNNGLDKMTAPGAVMFWDRPDDLKVALAAVKSDPELAAHTDMRRVGVAGFSAGGFTAMAAAGAQVSVEHFNAFCKDHGGCYDSYGNNLFALFNPVILDSLECARTLRHIFLVASSSFLLLCAVASAFHSAMTLVWLFCLLAAVKVNAQCTVSTIAGSSWGHADGSGTAASLNGPFGIDLQDSMRSWLYSLHENVNQNQHHLHPQYLYCYN
jgi:predicted dienelactone hydrolase